MASFRRSEQAIRLSNDGKREREKKMRRRLGAADDGGSKPAGLRMGRQETLGFGVEL